MPDKCGQGASDYSDSPSVVPARGVLSSAFQWFRRKTLKFRHMKAEAPMGTRGISLAGRESRVGVALHADVVGHKVPAMQCGSGDNRWACQLRVDDPSYGLPNSIRRHDRTGF